MSKSLKNFTTIRSVLSEKEWTARSLRICFLLMPWQDAIEVTDELMKAVLSWEDKFNNFFLKSFDVWKHYKPQSMSTQEPRAGDAQVLDFLEKAKAGVNAALLDSFNTPAAMRILADLVTHFNSAEAVSDPTVIMLAQWLTRIVTIFGLDPEGDLCVSDRVGWSGLDIRAPAKPYIYPASQLRDKVRTLARSAPIDYTAIAELASGIMTAAPTPVSESSKPYSQVLQRFGTSIQGLAIQQAPAKDLLALCDQLRDAHLWNLGIYLEDRASQPALVRPVDKLLVEARASQEAAIAAKAAAKLAQEARDADKEKEMRERAKVDPRSMFKTSDEYLEWDENGIPALDATGTMVSKSRRKKLLKEWEKQRKLHEEWRAAQ